MKKLAVIGWPIEHSLSPKMHGAALKAAGLEKEFSYEKIAVKPQDVAGFLDRIRSGEFIGTNVTVPHKVSVFNLVDAHDDAARMIGACNTVIRQPDGSLLGSNTDAPGAYGAIEEETGESVNGKNVLILGAGGAAMACATGAALGGAKSVTILNRTLEKARKIIDDLLDRKPEWKSSINFQALDKPDGTIGQADMVLQMTSLGMKPGDPLPVDPALLASHAIVLEAVYAPAWTAFRTQCKDRGLRTVDGLGMLVGQGAISFRMWTGIDPDRKVMTKAIR